MKDINGKCRALMMIRKPIPYTRIKMDDNGNNFVPSVVYLPVARRVSEPMTVAFDLTPA